MTQRAIGEKATVVTEGLMQFQHHFTVGQEVVLVHIDSDGDMIFQDENGQQQMLDEEDIEWGEDTLEILELKEFTFRMSKELTDLSDGFGSKTVFQATKEDDIYRIVWDSEEMPMFTDDGVTYTVRQASHAVAVGLWIVQ